MKNKKHSFKNDLLFILFSGFVVVVCWIGFNIYHIWATSTISDDIQSKLTPISASFDTTTIEKLKSREHINPAYVLDGPTVEVTPESRPTGIPQTASGSGQTIGIQSPTNGNGQ